MLVSAHGGSTATVETVHAPAPPAAECLAKRAKATIFPSTATTISASAMRMASRTSLDQEVQEPEPKSSANNPRFNQTQRYVLRLSQRSDPW
jgi:hypothetical protein